MADRHILVVGASSGIGFAVAERLAEQNRVTAIGRSAERLAPLRGIGARVIIGDVRDLENIPALVREAVAERGPLDTLIYAAGIQNIKPIRAMTTADITDLFTTNLVAPTVFATQFASKTVSAADATFCVISSVAALRPEPGIVAYGASKAGLDGLVRGLAKEIGPRRAVGVAPGWLDTPMTQSFQRLYGDDFRERLARNSPAGPATVAAVVDSVEFLISARAAHITGEIIRIDGGAAI